MVPAATAGFSRGTTMVHAPNEHRFACLPHVFLRREVLQVMRLGFRGDESVYTSVRGRQERPRGPPMAHMDYTNIYAPCRVRVIRF